MQEMCSTEMQKGASHSVTGSAGPRVGGEHAHQRCRSGVRGRTGSSPAHPFGGLATTREESREAHGFASPPHGGFALSRMKGVVTWATTLKLAPEAATKSGAPLCNEL